MGYHSTFCAITHAPITGGQRCVGIWTEKDKFSENNHNNPRSIFYRGTYDDYGCIVLDNNQKFTNLVSAKMAEDGPDMFLNERVYNAVHSLAFSRDTDEINNGTAFENSHIYSYCLQKLGFIKQSQKSSDPRYSTIYKHPTENNISVLSDTTWIRFDKKSLDDVYNWTDFQKIFPAVDYTFLKNISAEEIYIEKIYYAFLETVKDLTSREAELKQLLIKHFCMDARIPANFFPLLSDSTFRQELARVHRVISFMGQNYKVFGNMRHIHGPQDGNFNAYAKLHEIMAIPLNEQKPL